MMKSSLAVSLASLATALPLILAAPAFADPPAPGTLTGQAALGDWQSDAPGVRRLLLPSDLPPAQPDQTVQNSADKTNGIPEGAKPKVPPGFDIEMIASGIKNPRALTVALTATSSSPIRCRTRSWSTGRGARPPPSRRCSQLACISRTESPSTR